MPLMTSPSRTLRPILLALVMAGVMLGLVALPASAAHEPGAEEINVRLTITGATVDPQTGEVTVRGTIRCSERAQAFVEINVTQYVGRKTAIQGWGSTSLRCGPTARSFAVSVFGENGRFGPGRAVIRGFAYACVPSEEDPYGCAKFGFDEVETTVRLRND